MGDGDALLAAIIAQPDEDTPRLMYADWLEENARAVECRACLGSGSHALDPYELAARYGRGTATKILDAAKCLTCGGSGREQDERGLRAWWIRHSITSRSQPWDDDAVKRSIEIIQGCPPGSRLPRRVLWGPHDLLGTDQVWSFSRGFAEEFRLPLAAWQKHGPAAVRRHPVTAVQPTDVATNYWNGSAYTIYNRDRERPVLATPANAALPPDLYAFLEAEAGSFTHGRACYFMTPRGAAAALSRGLIAWAKAQPA